MTSEKPIARLPEVLHCFKMSNLVLLVFSQLVPTLQVQWPKGTYSLVKPTTGCPSGWYEGWRKQDNEDTGNRNHITRLHHFAGVFGRDMVFHYCTMDPHRSTSTHQWPKGNYCILRNGPSCPEGFHQGSVFWDDEDENNSNGHGGTLPSGSFTRDTLINYCCRNDGSFRTRIILPTSKPFYLLRYREFCQRVQDMFVREEIVHFDDEDKNNRNNVSGWYPLGAGGGRDHNLHYCFYIP